MASALPFPIARFSVEQYHRMIASGAFTEHDRLELIEGWVVTQMAKGPGHEYAVGQGQEQLQQRIPPGWHVRNQAPITLADSEPEPDLVVARGDRSAYKTRHPQAGEIALVVEVSDSSLAVDRAKGRTYGAAMIPEYWIVNLVERRIEVFTGPDARRDTGYLTLQTHDAGGSVTVRIAGQQLGDVAVATLLP
jgi:Uma2 family endonuclease